VIQLDLRPLGIGEILDRAVTLFVRRFAVLVLILALVAIPVAVLQYASAPSTASFLSDIQRVMTLPPGQPEERRAILRQLSQQNQIGAAGLFFIALGMVLGALSTTACMIGIAQAYAGALPSVRQVYREAVRRWPAQLAAGAVYMGLGFGLSIALGVAIVVVVLALAALTRASRFAALVIGIPLGLVVLAVFVGALVLLYFAAQMTLAAIALEEPNPIRGLAHGLRRTLCPSMFWRTMLVATVVFGVSLIGSLILLGIASTASALTHLTALYPVIAVTGGVVLNALVTTFVVIYSYDVRVRREGYDLAVTAQTSAL
jgi:MFS family permease